MRGVLFLGTPHGGSSYVTAGRMSAKLTTLLGSRKELFDFIDPESESLSELNDDFLRSYPHLGIFCFFEAQPPKNNFGLPQPLVVEKSSAVIPGRPHGVLNLDHMELNKFASENDQNYQKVCEVIRLLADDKTASPALSQDQTLRQMPRSHGDQHHVLTEYTDRRSVMSEQHLSFSSSRIIHSVQEQSETAVQAKLYLEQLRREDDFLEILQPKTSDINEIDIASRHEGTCDWIFDHNLFQEWNDMSNPDCRFLSIVAPPGWGKSVLAKHLLQVQLENTPVEDDRFVLGFFCKNTEGQNTASAIIKSFLHVLLSHRREFFQHIVPYMRAKVSENTLSFKSLWAMFVAILKDPSLVEVRVIIDGLDECLPDSQQELLRAIEKTLKEDVGRKLRSRILITSRPTPIAVEVGTRLGILHVSLDDVARDISAVVHTEVDKLASGRGYPSDLSISIKEKLENEAEGMFLWVGLVLEELNRDDHADTRKAIDEILATLPRSLGEFYARNLENISKMLRADARQMLQTLLVSPRPLIPDELANLFAEWPADCSSLAQLTPNIPLNIGRYAKAACGSFIRVTETSISFVHQSARDYLLTHTDGDAAATDFSLDLPSSHQTALKTCLRYLLLGEIVNMATDSSASNVDMLWTNYPFADYALTYWGYHARGAGELDQESKDLLKRFLVRKNTFADMWIDRTHRMFFEDNQIDTSNDKFDSILGALVLQDMTVVFIDFLQEITEEDFDMDQLDCTGFTPMIMAAGLGRTNLLDFLIKIGSDTNIEARHGGVALHYAPRDSAALLIEAGVDVNKKDKNGNTPLQYAARNGEEHTVELLLERQAKPDIANNSGVTPLYTALLYGQLAIAKHLLKCGADIRFPLAMSESLMFAAAASDDTSVVDFARNHGVEIDGVRDDGQTPIFSAVGADKTLEYLLQVGADVNHSRIDGLTALHYAAFLGSESSISTLIRYGADANAVGDDGRTVLHCACQSGKEKCVTMLMEHLSNLHMETCNKATALFQAVAARQPGLVRFLIERGFDVRHRDNLQLTPLHFAVAAAQDEIARLLIDAGADIDATDSYGETPLLCALNQKQHAIAMLLLELGADPNVACPLASPLHIAVSTFDLEVINEMITKGIDVNTKLSTGQTALHIAATDCYFAGISALLTAGADPWTTDKEGYTPLHFAVMSGASDTVKVLAEAMKNVNIQSQSGRTPLHYAATGGQPAVVEILLDNGADPNIKDHTGATASMLAQTEGYLGIAELLVGRGAKRYEADPEARSLGLWFRSDGTQRTRAEVTEYRIKLQAPIAAAAKEGFLPTKLDQRETYFMKVIAEGEKLMIEGTLFLHFVDADKG